MDLITPDDVASLFGSPFIQNFWPGIIGILLMFPILARGSRWLLLPVVLVFGFLQAWNIGLV